MILLTLLLACSPDGVVRRPPAEGLSDTSHADTGLVEGPCPRDMALVDEAFCIDQYEGALQERDGDRWVASSPFSTVGGREVRAVPAKDVFPQGYISGDEAALACEASGKRLCGSDEWLTACQGPNRYVYPYGDVYRSDACNDTYEGGGHPVVDLYGVAVWTVEAMNDPRINQQPYTLSPGGWMPDCRSDWDVYDMHGNLHEWVADPNGTFQGGFYVDAVINGPGCTYRTTAHGRSYHDYSTGFRCCSDPV